MTIKLAEDIRILSQQDLATLAAWAISLNHFEWPDELPNPEPPKYIRGDRRGQILAWIEDAIGKRAILHHLNVKLRGMSEDDFNDFYRGTFEGHEPSRIRSDQRVRRLVIQRPLSRGGKPA